MSLEKSGDILRQRTASVGDRSAMKTIRDMSLDRGCTDGAGDDAADDVDDDDEFGRCHNLTELSAAAVTKPPLGKSGYLCA